eukprot:gene3287-4233_t
MPPVQQAANLMPPLHNYAAGQAPYYATPPAQLTMLQHNQLMVQQQLQYQQQLMAASMQQGLFSPYPYTPQQIPSSTAQYQSQQQGYSQHGQTSRVSHNQQHPHHQQRQQQSHHQAPALTHAQSPRVQTQFSQHHQHQQPSQRQHHGGSYRNAASAAGRAVSDHQYSNNRHHQASPALPEPGGNGASNGQCVGSSGDGGAHNANN